MAKNMECNFSFEAWKGVETCPRLWGRSVAGYESLASQIVRPWGGLKAALVGGVSLVLLLGAGGEEVPQIVSSFSVLTFFQVSVAATCLFLL